jgi:hypothetical protein
MPMNASAQEKKKPNILVIWGDDVGVHNISAYNHGIMGYKTPNIDRIAREGALFTDAYAQQVEPLSYWDSILFERVCLPLACPAAIMVLRTGLLQLPTC